MVKIVIVTLDVIRGRQYGYDDYVYAPPQDRLTRWVDKIGDVSDDLKIKEPDAKWILVWPESNSKTKAFAAQDKMRFKEKMRALTKAYPQLAVIAGSVMTERRYDLKDSNEKGRGKLKRKFDGIADAYEEHRWIGGVEVSSGSQYADHLRRFNANRHLKGSSFRTLVRNTSYVFVGGDCLARHDKTAPYNELGDLVPPLTMFQPGKGRNKSPYIEIKYADGVTIPVGVEICREHGMGVLKRYCDIKKMKRPLIHFVLSDAIVKCHEHVNGDYFMHVDTASTAGLARMDDESCKSVEVVQYRANLLEKYYDLTGPLKPTEGLSKPVTYSAYGYSGY